MKALAQFITCTITHTRSPLCNTQILHNVSLNIVLFFIHIKLKIYFGQIHVTKLRERKVFKCKALGMVRSVLGRSSELKDDNTQL